MATTRHQIKSWFLHGKLELRARYMLVVCDTFDYEDFPVYVYSNDEFFKRKQEIENASMQRLMETYDLHGNMSAQLNAERCFNGPKP